MAKGIGLKLKGSLEVSTLFILLLCAGSLLFAQETQLEQLVFEIGRDLRCPVCTSESVADSNADIAIEMRNIIQEKLEAGESEAEIKAFFQARYGDWILLEPPKQGIHLFVWLLPTIAALLGAVVLFILFRRWTAATKVPVEAAEEDIARVREALQQTSPQKEGSA